MTKVVPAMYESLKCELAERLRVDEYEAAKFSAEEFAFALGKTFVEETTAEEIILVAAYELKDIDQVVRITERVVEDTVDSKRRLLYLPNLGCLYYGQACRMANGKEKERVLMKMETTFRECLSSMECKSSSVVEYCNIMCSQKRSSEALPLLEKLMDNYMGAPNAFLEYDGHEIYALDDNLKAYIEHGQKVRVDLLAYAYYLLAHCYQEVDPARLDEGFWNRFSAVCIAAENGRDLPSKLTFTLLGLALHTFGETEGAEDAFLQALEINHDDIVAKSFSPTAVQDLGMIDGQEAYVCPSRILMNSMNASSTEYSDLEKFGFDFDFTGLYE